MQPMEPLTLKVGEDEEKRSRGNIPRPKKVLLLNFQQFTADSAAAAAEFLYLEG